MKDFKVPIRYGIIGALVMCIYSFICYIFYRQLFGSFYSQIGIGLVSMVLMILIPVLGGLAFRKDRGEVLSFRDAFTGVLVVCAITFSGSSLMGYLIPNVIDEQYPEEVMRMMKTSTEETMEKFGASDEEMDKAMARFDEEQFKPTLLKTAQGYGISLGIGIILSLIIAAIIKRAPKPELQSSEPETVS